MSTNDRPFDPDEQALLDFGDRLVAGDARPPHTDLEATVVRVQRALRGGEAAPRAMPDALKAQIWEDLMASATVSSPPAVPAPSRASGPPSPVTPLRPPVRRMAWSHAATAALVLVLILAGVGVWRIADGGHGGGGGGTNEPARHPGLAAQPTTPETIEAPVVAPSPIATREPITQCDLRGDIPIIPDLAEDKSPVTTTSLYVVRYEPIGFNLRGDLWLGCKGEQSVMLASDVISISRGPWAGIVRLSILPPSVDDPAGAEPAYLNISTGAMVTFDPATNESPQSPAEVEGSPWVVGQSAVDPRGLSVVDLRTMERRPLSDLEGMPVSEDATVMLSTPAEDGTVVLGLAQTKYGDRLKTNTGAPGDMLLLGASFEDTHWITLSDELPLVTAVTLSPDGKHAALVLDGEGNSYAYGVISIADGTLVGRSANIERQENPFVTWVQNGKAAAFTSGNEIQTIAVDGTGAPTTVYRADQQMMHLQTTWDPDVVVAYTRQDHGSDAPATSADRDMVYSVNVETGEVHEFAGMDASASIGWITDAGALVMYQWDDTHPDTATYQVFDPVTGKQVGEIADAPSVQPKQRMMPTIGKSSDALSDDGRVEVIGLGTQHIYAFTAGPNGMTMRQLEAPGLHGERFLTASVTVSPDGTMLSLTGEEDEGRTRHLIALDDPNAEWLVIPNNVVGERGRGHITFAEGIGG